MWLRASGHPTTKATETYSGHVCAPQELGEHDAGDVEDDQTPHLAEQGDRGQDVQDQAAFRVRAEGRRALIRPEAPRSG
jgi:hypothetical protein